MATIMSRYSRTFRHRTEPGPTMAQWHEAMDLVDELVRENEGLNARLFAQARERDQLVEERNAAVRVSAHQQEKLDALRAHRRVTEGAGR
jgi:hypothetical protein